jgi:hypothetical protein
VARRRDYSLRQRRDERHQGRRRPAKWKSKSEEKSEKGTRRGNRTIRKPTPSFPTRTRNRRRKERDYEEKRRGGVEESDILLQTMKEGRRGKRRGKGKKWEEFLEIIITTNQPTNLTQAGRADPNSRRKE